MSDTVRTARLKGAKGAQKALLMLEARKRLEASHYKIDVFGALAELDVLVVFRPLNGLLGAYLRGTPPGVLINTNRPFTVQRFTAAHELGHAFLEHEPSIDTPDVLRRAAAPPTTKFSAAKMGMSFPAYLQEVEADAFAGDFLLPVWLMAHHAQQQGWSHQDLSRPEFAYQLALRCGASFDATTRALERNRIIPQQAAEALRKVQPKTIKAQIRTDPQWADPKADTWALSGRDEGRGTQVYVGDLVRVTLEQASGAGYLWEPRIPPSLDLVSDTSDVDMEVIGAPTRRSFTFRAVEEASTILELVHRRPWEAEGETLKLPIISLAAEEGLSRANRNRQIAE